MGCSPARFFKFQIRFFSGCSPFWITCKKKFSATRVSARSKKKVLGRSPCFPYVFSLACVWAVAQLDFLSFKLSFFSGCNPFSMDDMHRN